MKQVILLFSLAMATLGAKAQSFNFQLTGNPVDVTGWTTATQSFVDNDMFVLTNNIGDQAGYIYYSTPQNLTNCSQFTVTFDFRITNSSTPTADGIAFWYISNPPTGFTAGSGIGMPNNPNGLLMIMDTYNNSGPNTMPKVSLRRLDGTTNYVESSTTGQLQPDLVSQTFITNGNWHTCTINYYFGTVTVAFDGNPPVMTGSTTLNLNGYFGFSASTGGSWAKHAIKNVVISGAPEPAAPIANDVTYCQDAPATPLTAVGTNMSWFTTPTGGTALAGAPTPSTAVAGTFNWYVSQAVPGCAISSVRDTLTVTVNPKPGVPTIQVPGYCSGQTGMPITVVSGNNVLWYTAPTGGTGDPVIPTVNTAVDTAYTWYATQTSALGCESDRVAVTAIVRQTPTADFTQTIGYACGSDTVHFQNTSTDATSYFWDFNDGFTDLSTNPSHVYSSQNIYYVKLRANNQYCADSVVKPVDIQHPLLAAFTTSADTLCVGSTITFTNASTAGVIYNTNPSYYWDFGDGATANTPNAVHTFNQQGTYTVMMVVKDGVPCSDTAFKTVFVDSLPDISFTRSDTALCTGQVVFFNANFTQSGLDNIQWNFGDNGDLIANTNPTQHAYEQPGVYNVTIYGNYRVCPDVSATAQINVKAMPVIYLGRDTTLCLDGTAITVGDNTNAGNPQATWMWSTGATTSSIQIKHDGTYTATVTIDQCSTSDDITVVKDCIIDIPNSFTPNGDGVNDYFFPRQYLSKGVTAFTMSVFDRWGQKVFETKNPSGRGWDGKFNEKNQPVGVYIYQINVVMKNMRTEEYTGNVTLLR
jgi:gliding motility-associated-like protein